MRNNDDTSRNADHARSKKHKRTSSNHTLTYRSNKHAHGAPNTVHKTHPIPYTTTHPIPYTTTHPIPYTKTQPIPYTKTNHALEASYPFPTVLAIYIP